MNVVARLVVDLIAVSTLVACSATPTQPVELAEQLHDVDGVAAARLLPAESREATFQWTIGPDEGRTSEYRFAPTDDGAFRATLEDRHVARLEADDTGAWRMPREDDLQEQLTIQYDPPLVVLPARLEAGEPFTAEYDMAVRNIESGTPRDRGTCELKVELLGRRTMRIAGEEVEVMIVRSTRRLDLTLADVTVTITTGYQPKVGVVVEHVHQRVKSLGMFEKSEQRQRVVIAP